MLRNPVSRLVSQFRFGVQRGGWSADTPVATVLARGGMADNLQTRQLAGLVDRRIPCTAEVFRTAIDHLNQDYTIVGIAERFDATLKLLITLLGWPDIAFGNAQVGQVEVSESVSAQAEALIPRYFAYDVDLYAAACEIATQRMGKLLKGEMCQSDRQDSVLVCIPGLFDGQKYALVSAKMFERNVRPALEARGGEILTV
jgi:hypothetical protein